MRRREVEADAAEQSAAVLDAPVGRPDPNDVDVVTLDGKVGRHDGRSPRRERRHELALRPADALDGVDQLEVDRADVREHADLRTRDLAQGPNLAEAAHRELEDANLGVRLEPAEGQGDADLVVEARLRRDRACRGCAECGEDVLRRSLPHRARDPDDACGAAVADVAADATERDERVVRDQRRSGAMRASVLEELRARPDGHEQVAGGDSAGVDLDARELVLARVYLSEAGKEGGRKRNHAGVLRFRSAARATSRSSNGIVRSANSWPCSCPLPPRTAT